MADASNKNAPKTKEYVLKPGYRHHGIKDDTRHIYVGGEKDNDRVQLTEAQAAQFRDRFESVEEQKERVKLQSEVEKLRQEQEKLNATLAEKGMSLDDLLALAATAKKPDPTPSVGTAEPAPSNVTPPPTGSTAAPTAGTQAAATSTGGKK